MFKLTPGACPKSYGPSVARAAGVPASIAERAVTISNDFESSKVAGAGSGTLPEDTADGKDAALMQEFAAVWRKIAPASA